MVIRRRIVLGVGIVVTVTAFESTVLAQNPDLAIRFYTPETPTQVVVASVVELSPIDALAESFIQPGLAIVPSSVKVWHGTDGSAPCAGAPIGTPDHSCAQDVTDQALVQFIGPTMVITGVTFNAVSYELAIPPIPGFDPIGQISFSSQQFPIVQVASIGDWILDLIVGDVCDMPEDQSVTEWVSDTDVDDLLDVTIDGEMPSSLLGGYETNITQANAGGEFSWGILNVCNTDTDPEDNTVQVLGIAINNYCEVASWVGMAYHLNGCNPTRDLEDNAGVIAITETYHGEMWWTPICIPLLFPPYIVCGEAVLESCVNWDVRQWPEDQFIGPGAVVYASDYDSATTGVPWDTVEMHEDPDPATHFTDPMTHLEDQVYLTRLTLRTRAQGIMAVGWADFWFERDDSDYGLCTGGVFEDPHMGGCVSEVSPQFNNPPLPDFQLDPIDIDVPSVVIAGDRVDMGILEHNYGTDSNDDVEISVVAFPNGTPTSVCLDSDSSTSSFLDPCPVVSTLDACGGSEYVKTRWCAAGTGETDITATMDPDLEVAERIDDTSEGLDGDLNNAATVTTCVLPQPTRAIGLVMDRSDDMKDTIGIVTDEGQVTVEKRELTEAYADKRIESTKACVDKNVSICSQCMPSGDAAFVLDVSCDPSGETVRERLGMTYLTSPNQEDCAVSDTGTCDTSGKQAALDSVPGNYADGMALWDGIQAGAEALCCMNNGERELHVLTNGQDDCSTGDPGTACLAAKDCCVVPLVLVPSLDALTAGELNDLETCADVSGAGLFEVPQSDDSADHTVFNEKLEVLLSTADQTGVTVLPFGKTTLNSSTPGIEDIAGLHITFDTSIADVQPGFQLRIDAPPGLEFAGVPNAHSSDMTLGQPQLVNNSSTMIIPVVSIPLGCGRVIVIDKWPSIKKPPDITPLPDGNIEFTVAGYNGYPAGQTFSVQLALAHDPDAVAQETCQDDLAFGGPGGATLSMCGDPLATGGTADLILEGAPPFAPAFLVVGLSFNPLAFGGGFVTPMPYAFILNLGTDGQGQIVFPDIAGGGGPFLLYAQYVIADPMQPLGYSISNAIEMNFLP